MKPRFGRFTKAAFPALIVVPSLLQVAQAQLPSHLINPDAAGNVVVAGDFDELNGEDWTVLASGGPTAPFSVKIKSGAFLTGASENGNGVVVTSENYTIKNSGTLDVRQHGIISSVGDTVIKNNAGGLIQGGTYGVLFDLEDAIIASSAPLASEVPLLSGGTVLNDGAIIGDNSGIYSQSGIGLTVENHESGVITGYYGAGIASGDNLFLTNDGTINGSGGSIDVVATGLRSSDGVTAGYDASITNNGSITGWSGNGIYSYDGLNLENSGSITGNGYRNVVGVMPVSYNGYYGSGVSTGDDAVIVNLAGGSIAGVSSGISAGSNLDLTNYGLISGSDEGEGYAGVSAYEGANITNFGDISGDQFGIVIGESIIDSVQALDEVTPSNTITNSGTITGSEAAISLGYGDNVVNLDFGSTINGDIRGGGASNQLNFLSGSESISEENNIVHGNVYGMDVITKSQSGYAFIGGAGESFDVFTDTINITGGGLVINGRLSSLSEGRTQVNLIDGGQLDGTGNWNADIALSSGGLSAGATTNVLNVPGDAAISLSTTKTLVDSVTSYSVGALTINGNVATNLESIDPPVLSSSTKLALPIQSSSYIRVDINPQTEIISGVNNDIINQVGFGNTFDLTGLGIRLAPSDINKSLTEGTYTIVDSDSPLLGVDSLGPVGLHFTSSAPDSGPFHATESGENSLNTVLTNYFTTIGTEDPVNEEETVRATVSAAAVPVLDPNNSNLVVTIQHNYEGLPGLTKTQAAMGGIIDGLVNSPNPIIQDFIAALDYSDLAGVQATLATLDPSATMGMANSVINSDYRLHRLTQEHLAQIRGNGRQESEAAPSSKDAKGVITPGQTTVHSTGRGNAWGSFSYDGQDNSGSDSNADFDGNAGAFTAGVDWLFAPQLVLGIVLDGSKGDFDADGFSSDVDSFRGAVYGTWGGSMGFYSDALIGFGTHSLDSSLGSNGVLVGETSNDTDADSFQALWTAGYTMGDDKVKHGPFGGFEYQNIGVDGYTQGGPLAIKVDSYDVESFRALIGYRVNVNLGTFRPYASVAYAHEFQDGSNSTTATLAGVPFRVSGADQSSAFIITAGTAVVLTRDLTLDIGYRGDIATDDGITSNGGSLGLNYSF